MTAQRHERALLLEPPWSRQRTRLSSMGRVLSPEESARLASRTVMICLLVVVAVVLVVGFLSRSVLITILAVIGVGALGLLFGVLVMGWSGSGLRRRN